MRRRRSRKPFLIVLLTMLAITLVVAAFVVRQISEVYRHLDRFVAQALEVQLDRQVSIGRVVSKRPGVLIVDDLVIQQRPPAARPLARVRRAEIRYDFAALILRRQSPIQTISQITLYRPEVFLRRFGNGQWSIQDLFRPRPGPRRPGFQGVVLVRDAELTLIDSQPLNARRRPFTNHLIGINGALDARAHPRYPFQASGRGTQGRVRDFTMTGLYIGSRGALDVTVQARDLQASYWWNYFTNLRTVQPIGGHVDLGLRVTRVASRRPIDYAANLRIRNVTARVPQARVPLRSLSGHAALVGPNITLNVTGSLAGIPVRVEGSVYNFAKPQLALALRSDRVTDAALRQAFPDYASVPVGLVGPAQVRLRILGPASSPVAEASVAAPGARISGYTLGNVSAQARYVDRLIQIQSASATLAGGIISTSGTVDLTARPIDFAFSGTATNVALSRIALPPGLRVSGTGDARFTVARRNATLLSDAEVQLRNGQLLGIDYNTLTASIRSVNNSVRIPQATLSLPRGTLRASGTVNTTGPVDLRVVGFGVDIGSVLAPFGVRQLSGTAFFSGSITGTAQNPTFRGQTQVFAGRLQGLAFDFLQGQLTATRQRVSFTNVIARRFPAQYIITGQISIERGRLGPISVEVRGERLTVAELLRSLGIEAPITGTLEGTVRIEGRPGAIGVAGSFQLTDGAIDGIPITTASGSFRLVGGVLTLTDVAGRTDGGAFTLSGGMGPANRLDLTLIANNLPLSLLERFTSPYAILGGRADMTARITGTTTRPIIAAELRATPLTINQQEFDSLTASMTFENERVTFSNLALIRGTTRFEVTRGIVNVADETINAEINAVDVHLANLLEMTINSPYLGTPQGQKLAQALSRIPRPVQGILSSTITLQGPLSALRGQVAMRTTNISMGTTNLDAVVLNATLTGDAVVINEFAATRGETALRTLRGRISYAGALDLDFDVYNLQLSALQSFVPTSRPISGQVNVLSAVVGGTIRNPVITANFDISNAVIGGLQFDRISSSPIVIANGRATFDQILIRRGIHTLAISGPSAGQPAFVPVDLAGLRIPRDQPLLLHAELANETLGILPAFIPGFPSAEGTLNASVDVAGTLSNPTLTGLLTIANGQLPIPRFATTLRNIQARLVLQGSTIRFEQFTGSGASGDFSLTGTVALGQLPEATLDLQLNTTALQINEENLTGYGENFRGKISTSLAITGPWRTPLISGPGGQPGTIRIFDATLTIPTLAAPSFAAVPTLPINPRFLVDIDIDGNVTLASALFRVQASGNASVRGTLASPQLVGHLTTSRGVVYYPSAILRVTEGRVDFVVAPPLPARIDIDTRARTTISGVQINLRAFGPLSNMRFDVSSTPALPQQQLLSLLLRQEQIESILRGQDVSSVLGSETLRILTAQLEPRILLPFEFAIQQALGLDEFSLEFGFGATPTLIVSRRLFDKVYATYYRSYVGPGGVRENYRVLIGYRFQPRLQVGWSTNDIGIQRITIDGSLVF